jgi:hypothetical protein
MTGPNPLNVALFGPPVVVTPSMYCGIELTFEGNGETGGEYDGDAEESIKCGYGVV